MWDLKLNFSLTNQNASVFVNESNAVFTNYCIHVNDKIKENVRTNLVVCDIDDHPRATLNFVDILGS